MILTELELGHPLLFAFADVLLDSQNVDSILLLIDLSDMLIPITLFDRVLFSALGAVLFGRVVELGH